MKKPFKLKNNNNKFCKYFYKNLNYNINIYGFLFYEKRIRFIELLI